MDVGDEMGISKKNIVALGRIIQLRKALFIMALASGLRVSQLSVLNIFPPWTVFKQLLDSDSLMHSPAHLVKNDWEDHQLDHVVVPSLCKGRDYHSLFLVIVLHT